MRYIRLLLGLFLLFVIISVALFIIEQISFRTWVQGGKFVTKPNTNILATATYLYNNPLPTPQQIEWIQLYQEDINVCIRTYKRIIGGDNLFTRWFLNGERVPYERYHFFSYGTLDYCLGLYGILPGLHLLEIQVNGSPFYTAMSYQFAIKIEPSPTPSPTSPAP